MQRVDGKPRTDYQTLKAKAGRARFILGKIAKNEAEGKTDPRHAEDKLRCKETIAQIEAQRANLATEQTQLGKSKRKEEGQNAPKRAKDAKGDARATSFGKAEAHNLQELRR